MANILISGGSGLIGRHLTKRLLEKGYNVAILNRSNRKIEGVTTYVWNIDKGVIDQKAIDKADYIIHLAGSNMGESRWTPERKKIIIDSRVKSAELIFKAVKASKKKPKAFISASAVGYYGAITSDTIFEESAPPGTDFLGSTCKLWEQAADQFNELGIRTVKIRTAVVLSKEGGVLERMITPIKMGVGSPLGDGNQYFPWIHIEDITQIYIKAIEDDQMKGAYNASAPDMKTNKEFTHSLAKALNKPFWFPNVPAAGLKLLFGEMAEMLLKGSRVSPDKIIATNFKFKFPDLKSALRDVL